MRRYLAGALLLLMIGQSSGAATAATTGSSPSINLRSLFAPLQSAITSSFLYAVLTGSAEDYAAMHMSAPVMQRPESSLNAAELMRNHHALRPRVRKGIRRPLELPPRSALDPRHRALDPLAMRRSTLKPTAVPLTPTGAATTTSDILAPLHFLTVPQGPHGSHRVTPSQGGHFNPMTSLSLNPGIEHWWAYEERAIPGIGKAMLNVGTGNFIVAAMDVDVPEQGIDLAFQRVYNSQSLHDYNGDDGGDPAIFGNRWTNDFDTSIVYNSTQNTITVYDIDGTACTYTANGGSWKACTGEYATLAPVAGSNDCSYVWTKKNGTQYLFHSDQVGTGCGIAVAKRGHLEEIVSRNANNYITFTYSYNGQGSTSEDVTQIEATHSDGQSLTMQFGVIPGTSINELQSVQRPDGAVLEYLYDTSGNLLEVDKPGNNSASSISNPPHTLPQGDVPETYAYASGTSTMQEACGPRCTVAMWNNPNNPTDGSALLFTSNGSLQLTSWQAQGVMNFTPPDGTGTPLQSGYSTSFATWYTSNFVYGNGSACSTTGGTGTTTMCDSDGHGAIWTLNGNYNVTKTKDYTGTAEALWIVTLEGWDANNDLISTTDANTNITNYAYDTAGYNQGNVVEVELPQASDFTVNGQNVTVSPLSYYSYDQYNNVTSYCDPVWTQSNGKSWNNSPGDSLCPGTRTSGTAYFVYSSDPGGNPDSNEPFGCLASMYRPSEYQTNISYPGNPGPCGYGLPAEVQAANQINQYDGSTRTPTQDFGYDSLGNLTSYDRGQGGGYTLDSWTLTYDPDNLNISKTQNDPTIANAVITSYSCHYPDGSLLYTETPSQWAADGNPTCPSTTHLLNGNFTPPTKANAYYYDLDGDQVKMITHKGCASNNACPGASPKTACVANESNPIGTTCKYYDGLDRLVETIEPYDSRNFTINSVQVPYECYAFRWMNRYIYDLSQSGGSANLKISGSTGTVSGLVAYGGLYKTQEYVPHPQNMIATLGGCPYSSGSWTDIRGSSFDGLDRPVSKYELAYGTTAVTTNTYDGNGQLDLLSSTTNAVGQVTSYTYDTINRVKQITFTGTNPKADNRAFTFDPDGRTASATGNGNASFGMISYTYDVDGNELSVTEPNTSQYTGASLICYSYYPDGLREYLSVGPAGVNGCSSIKQNLNPNNGGISQPDIFSYAYTHAGLLATQLVTWSAQETFTWAYTPSERELSETDPLNNTQISGYATIGPKSYQYDPYGRVAQLTFPEQYQESTFVYDVDDELAGYTIGGQGGTIRTLTLNARGELLEDTTNSTLVGWAQGPTYSANGAQVGNGDSTVGGAPVEAPPTTLHFDVRSNMAKCIPNPGWAQVLPGSNVYTYDGAGRQVETGTDPNGTECSDSYATTPTTYDAENHVQMTQNTWALNAPPVDGYTTANASWGPDLHRRIDTYSGNGSSNLVETAHWDGDSILFSTWAPSSPYLYIGKLAIMDTSGDILVLDRDQTGTQVTSHGNIASGSNFLPVGPWYTGLTYGSVRHLYAYKQNQSIPLYLSSGSCGSNPCAGFAPMFPMTRSDGYTMAGGIVQGARTYDPTSGQWLTPDAYAGDIRDPMSQKPFMWNDNNPVEWSDPSGYQVAQALEEFEPQIISIGNAVRVAVGPVIGAAAAAIYNLFRGQSIPLQGGPPNSQTRRGDTVVTYGPNGNATSRIDLGGRSHGGVAPPHVQDYKTYKDPQTGKEYVNKDGPVRNATPAEAQQASKAPPGNSPLPQGQQTQPGNSGSSNGQKPP